MIKVVDTKPRSGVVLNIKPNLGQVLNVLPRLSVVGVEEVRWCPTRRGVAMGLLLALTYPTDTKIC